ncbi:MAG: 5-aminolevulinate synthase, partial [Pseudomonadota bacterium]
MNFETHFSTALSALHDAGNYRVFAELERQRGSFPRATRYREDGSTHEVTVWCSND